MNEREKIQELEAAMRQLAGELQATQAKLYHLHQQLQQLKGQPVPPAPAASGASPFSLENFIGLRLIHLVGIIVLVIGISIGVKYAIDRELISEFSRIGLAYAASGVLFILSWRLKQKYTGFSAILFSGAAASAYFTTYAAYVYYGMFPFFAAFLIMIGLTLWTVYQALRYNRQEIAILGLVGAYGIPFLISTNAGRAELLFAYVALINTAVVFLSYKKGWQLVAYLAQLITWMLLAGWAITRYQAGQEWIGLLFPAYFFLLFVFHALSGRLLRGAALAPQAVRQVAFTNGIVYVLAILLFSPSFSQAELGRISAFFTLFAGLQAALCFFMLKEPALKKMLVLLTLVLFLIFIANRWDGFSVTLLWLAVAVVVFACGFMGKAVWLRLSAMILMGVTLLKLVAFDSLRFTTIQKIIAYLALGVLLMVVGFFYQKFRQKLFNED